MSEYTGKKLFTIHVANHGTEAYTSRYVMWLEAEIERLRAELEKSS